MMTRADQQRGAGAVAGLLIILAALLQDSPVAAAEQSAGHAHANPEVVAAGQAEPGETVGVARLELSREVLAEYGIELRTAAGGKVAVTRRLYGEISQRPQSVAEITPPVSGSVVKVARQVGDHVEAGELLAVIVSETLAQAKTDFLAASSRLDLVRQTLARKEQLAEQGVASQAELLEARHAVRSARAESRSTRRRLDVLGVDSQAVAALEDAGGQALARYEITAPRSGTLIEQRLRVGQWQSREGGGSAPLVIADPDSVWAELQVYSRYLSEIAAGQKVRLYAGDSAGNIAGDQRVEQMGEVAHIMPQLDAVTRTATARVPLHNADGQWPPGQFVTAEVAVDEAQFPVVIPRTAVQSIDQVPVVFVAHDDGLEPRRVALGTSVHGKVAVTAGLHPGERYAATHTFPLKAELQRGQLEEAGHDH